MILANLLGWIGNIFFIAGVLLIAKKNPHGFYSNIVANALYAGQALMTEMTSLFVLSILLMFLNLYGIYKWNQEK